MKSIPRRSGDIRQPVAFIKKKSDVVGTSTWTNDAREVRGGEGGTATMQNEMFNMVKAVVGVGVLSLPAGE